MPLSRDTLERLIIALASAKAGQELADVVNDASLQLATRSEIGVSNITGVGSTNTKVLKFGNIVRDNGGADIEYIPSETDGDSFKINTEGIYAITMNPAGSNGDEVGITRNASGTDLKYTNVVTPDIKASFTIKFNSTLTPNPTDQFGNNKIRLWAPYVSDLDNNNDLSIGFVVDTFPGGFPSEPSAGFITYNLDPVVNAENAAAFINARAAGRWGIGAVPQILTASHNPGDDFITITAGTLLPGTLGNSKIFIDVYTVATPAVQASFKFELLTQPANNDLLRIEAFPPAGGSTTYNFRFKDSPGVNEIQIGTDVDDTFQNVIDYINLLGDSDILDFEVLDIPNRIVKATAAEENFLGSIGNSTTFASTPNGRIQGWIISGIGDSEHTVDNGRIRLFDGNLLTSGAADHMGTAGGVDTFYENDYTIDPSMNLVYDDPNLRYEPTNGVNEITADFLVDVIEAGVLLAFNQINQSGMGFCSVTLPLIAGDIIRFQFSGNTPGFNGNYELFNVCKLI